MIQNLDGIKVLFFKMNSHKDCNNIFQLNYLDDSNEQTQILFNVKRKGLILESNDLVYSDL
jgi:hypothetical protein